MAIKSDISAGNVFIGGTKILDFHVKQADGTTPQTMTGWSLLFVMRAGSNSFEETYKVVKTTDVGGGITISNHSGTDDKASVSLSRSDTVNWPSGEATYALWRSDDPNDEPLAYGTINLTAVARQ